MVSFWAFLFCKQRTELSEEIVIVENVFDSAQVISNHDYTDV